MGMAKEMVGLANRLKAVEGGGSEAAKEDGDVADMLANLGIANPVTKTGTSASQYHQDLAHELNRVFGGGKLEVYGGMLELSDVYCVYNRARYAPTPTLQILDEFSLTFRLDSDFLSYGLGVMI